jgi:hypothetical protein
MIEITVSRENLGPQGQTPVLQYSFTWTQLSAVAGRELAGSKLLIIWDRLQAHRSRLVRDWIETQGGDVQLEFLPPYAPELNPVEYLWAHW